MIKKRGDPKASPNDRKIENDSVVIVSIHAP